MAHSSELEFNKHRRLELLNLPNCTEREVRDFLVGVSIKNVKLSESCDSAIVNLSIGRQLEDAVQKYNGKQFKDNSVVTKPGANPNMMAIGHIPQSYTDKDFKAMCDECGSVEYAYIMRTSGGMSKGYGIVEFKGEVNQLAKIKEELDWKEVNGQSLHADVVEAASQASYENMQSKCLLITGIPETFTDVSKMREMFGCVTSPVYCQIISKDDKSMGYGIVEYRTHEEAEETWLKMKNEKIDDKELVISFCIPGKSAVVINNRITWKFGDKLQKSSLLPDPVAIKPVISGNPLVISLSQANPKLMASFKVVLGELQQAYVSQMMSPVNKPGLLGPAPSLPLSPMMNPNMQLGLLAMLAIHMQVAKKETFSGALAKQLNTLSEQDLGLGTTPKPSILGDPMTGQANVILASLKQQLNQVPLKDADDKEVEEPTELDEKLQYLEKKFVANGRYLNLSLLSNLGQLLVTMMQSNGEFTPRGSGTGLLNTPPLSKGQSLLGPVPGSGLMPTPNTGNKSGSLLGDAPNATGRNPPLMGNAPGINNNAGNQSGSGTAGGSGRMNTLSQTLLGQISQGLVHQIGQNLMYQLSVNQQSKPSAAGASGKGLLGDVPVGGPANTNVPKSKPAAAKNSLLGEPPNQFNKGGNQQASTPLDQGSWKATDNRWGGASNYESGYSNKSTMGNNYGDYGYGQDSYSQQDMGGNFGGGNYGSGYGENDFYNSYQQQMYNMSDGTSGYYAEYSSSNFGTGTGFGSGTGAGSMGGGGGNYSVGAGMLGNQASGVNFQDGQSFGKGSTSNGLGQDSARYGTDNYGGMMGNTNYSYSSGREDMGGDSGYDSYRSTMGMAGGYGSTGMNDGMGGMGMSGSMGGMAGTSGMGGGSGMGSMGLMGSGSSMANTGNVGMGGFGNSYSTTTTTGMGAANNTNNMMGAAMAGSSGSGMVENSYSTGMSPGRMGMSGSGGGSSSGTMGMMGSSMYGTGNNGSKMGMSGFGTRDQNTSYYQSMGSSGSSGASGLLPNPGKYLSPGQKRTYSQYLPKQETNTDGSDYVGQHSQGLGGHYMESFKRSRLY